MEINDDLFKAPEFEVNANKFVAAVENDQSLKRYPFAIIPVNDTLLRISHAGKLSGQRYSDQFDFENDDFEEEIQKMKNGAVVRLGESADAESAVQNIVSVWVYGSSKIRMQSYENAFNEIDKLAFAHNGNKYIGDRSHLALKEFLEKALSKKGEFSTHLFYSFR